MHAPKELYVLHNFEKVAHEGTPLQSMENAELEELPTIVAYKNKMLKLVCERATASCWYFRKDS